MDKEVSFQDDLLDLKEDSQGRHIAVSSAEPAQLDSIRGGGQLPVLGPEIDITSDGVPENGAKLRRRPSDAGSDITVSDRGERLYDKAFPHGSADLQARIPEVDRSMSLMDQLLMIRCQPDHKPEYFFPRGSLEMVIDENIVRQAIVENRGQFTYTVSEEEIMECAKKVCQSSDGHGHGYRKIFTILVLSRRSWDIVLFVRHGLSDADLPLKAVPIGSNGKLFRMRRANDPHRNLDCFRGWDSLAHEEFDKWQWSTLSPFFAEGDKRRVWFYQLSQKDILPWTWKSEQRQGGSSTVFRVQIHPNHHNFVGTELSNGSFAVKHFRTDLDSRLEPDTIYPSIDESPIPIMEDGAINQPPHSTHLEFAKKEFEAEIEILRRLKGVHPNLMNLLAAFQQGREYYLLFHWANSDLLRFWQDNNAGEPLEKPNLRWVLCQCRDIAEGLLRIHEYKPSVTQMELKVPGAPIFGRHGDLKPENILYFKNRADSQDRGILMITDFGLTRFHSLQTRTYRRRTYVAATPTYRPPECDMKDSTISRSFDIWSLGCVFLEFITWYLGGWSLVRQFVDARKAPDIYGFNSDQFFEIVRAPRHDEVDGESWAKSNKSNNDDKSIAARVKYEVLQFINDLHSHPRCSSTVHEWLDFIQNEMLVIESSGHFESRSPGSTPRRANCSEVLRKLSTLYDHLGRLPSTLIATPRERKEAETPEAIEVDLSQEAQSAVDSRKENLREHTGKTLRLRRPGTPEQHVPASPFSWPLSKSSS